MILRSGRVIGAAVTKVSRPPAKAPAKSTPAPTSLSPPRVTTPVQPSPEPAAATPFAARIAGRNSLTVTAGPPPKAHPSVHVSAPVLPSPALLPPSLGRATPILQLAAHRQPRTAVPLFSSPTARGAPAPPPMALVRFFWPQRPPIQIQIHFMLALPSGSLADPAAIPVP